MDFKFERLLDQIGVKILYELQMNARMPFSEIGRRVGLSSPAVAERVKKMEDAGIIILNQYCFHLGEIKKYLVKDQSLLF